MIAIPVVYYVFGLLWLLSGVVTGWLRWDGHPLAVAIWIITGAAVWPWFVYKILRDLARGQQTTNLQGGRHHD